MNKKGSYVQSEIFVLVLSFQDNTTVSHIAFNKEVIMRRKEVAEEKIIPPP